MKTKFPIIYIFVLFTVIIAQSCDDQDENDKKGKDFQQNLSSFNTDINSIDKTLTLMDSMQNEIKNIESDRALGKISEEEASLKLADINNTLGREIYGGQHTDHITQIPQWALKLGLSAPSNMTLDKDYSQSTSENNSDFGYNSIILVYKGNYNEAIKQADIIAKKANIPMSKDYKDALILARDYDIETIKGASYMNFDFGKTDNPRYNISITVDDYGTLTISATDTYALKKQLDL